ncbi:zinc-ribbon domain-containing protein [Vibrio sinaloensis]|nr:zinc-ribbon domain-containing protein [Vibrio sinaloensis]
MDWQGHYHCSDCDERFNKVGFFALIAKLSWKKLQACGAANYFCNSCNELKI